MEATASQQRDKPRRGKGRPFVAGVSGNPKGRRAIRERASELFAIMAPDFGELSATDTVLLNQACLLLARSERVGRMRDLDVNLRMSGEARRLLATLRKPDRRRQRESEQTLSEYLARQYGEGARASSGASLAAQNPEQAVQVSSAEERTSEARNGSAEEAT